MRFVIKALWVSLLGFFAMFPVWAQEGLYVPTPGSVERKAIMEAAHAAVDPDKSLHFMVKGLKVFAAGDRAIAVAWLNDPHSGDNGGFFYFEQKNNHWKARYATDEGGGASGCDLTVQVESAIIAGVKNIGAPENMLSKDFYDEYAENKRYAKEPDTDCAMSDKFD
jgi:hypothetical protein